MPTITTVARLANVSVASASRALNGIRTSPATFERVIAAAESVGYVPNAAASSPPPAPDGPDRLRHARHRQPRSRRWSRRSRSGAGSGVRLLAPLDRRRPGGRAGAAARPGAPLRRRASSSACSMRRAAGARRRVAAAPVVVIGRPGAARPWTRCGRTRARARPTRCATCTPSAGGGSPSSTGRPTPRLAFALLGYLDGLRLRVPRATTA